MGVGMGEKHQTWGRGKREGKGLTFYSLCLSCLVLLVSPYPHPVAVLCRRLSNLDTAICQSLTPCCGSKKCVGIGAASTTTANTMTAIETHPFVRLSFFHSTCLPSPIERQSPRY